MICIIGGDSMIGKALAQRCAIDGIPFDTTSRRHTSSTSIRLDLSTVDIGTWSVPDRPVAIICAAETKVSACANSPEATAYVNCTQTIRIIKKLLKHGSYVIFLSSNMAASPSTEYGRQKALVENIFKDVPNICCVRLPKVFPDKAEVRPGWFKPMPLGSAIDFLMQIVHTKPSGIIQAWSE